MAEQIIIFADDLTNVADASQNLIFQSSPKRKRTDIQSSLKKSNAQRQGVSPVFTSPFKMASISKITTLPPIVKNSPNQIHSKFDTSLNIEKDDSDESLHDINDTQLPQISYPYPLHSRDDDACSISSNSSIEQTRVAATFSSMSVSKPTTHSLLSFGVLRNHDSSSGSPRKGSTERFDHFPHEMSSFDSLLAKAAGNQFDDDDLSRHGSPIEERSARILQSPKHRGRSLGSPVRLSGFGSQDSADDVYDGCRPSAPQSPCFYRQGSNPSDDDNEFLHIRGRARSEISPPRDGLADFGTPLTEKTRSPTDLGHDDLDDMDNSGYDEASMEFLCSHPHSPPHGHRVTASPDKSSQRQCSSPDFSPPAITGGDHIQKSHDSCNISGVSDLSVSSVMDKSDPDSGGCSTSNEALASPTSSSPRTQRSHLRHGAGGKGLFPPFNRPAGDLGSASRPLPLPDQSAFDRSALGSKPSPHSSPMCPDTPLRTPSYYHQEVGSKHAQRLPQRQNSLGETKVLLTDDGEDGVSLAIGNVCFHRDFDDEGQLGKGAFADVFKVRERSGERRVFAVKKMKAQFRTRKSRDVAMDEVRCMRLLQVEPCEFIIHFYKAWQEDGVLHVQMELAERGTVKEFISTLASQNSHVPEATVWKIVHDVSAGLNHIHKFNMVHLDIKPANLLISRSGVVKIGDFGMAVEQGQADEKEGDSKYIAPEIFTLTSDRNPPNDIFSFGISIYEICRAHEVDSAVHDLEHSLTHQYFQLPDNGPMWHTLREGDAEPLSDRSAMLQHLVTVCMSPKPSERPSALSIMSTPESERTQGVHDPVLCAAPMAAPMVPLNRTASFNPTMLEGAHALTINAKGLQAVDCDERVHTPTGELNFWQPVNRDHPFFTQPAKSASSLQPYPHLHVPTKAFGGGFSSYAPSSFSLSSSSMSAAPVMQIGSGLASKSPLIAAKSVRSDGNITLTFGSAFPIASPATTLDGSHTESSVDLSHVAGSASSGGSSRDDILADSGEYSPSDFSRTTGSSGFSTGGSVAYRSAFASTAVKKQGTSRLAHMHTPWDPADALSSKTAAMDSPAFPEPRQPA